MPGSDENIKLPLQKTFYVLPSHFQPIETPTRFERLGMQLRKSDPKLTYTNVHFSQVEGIFATQEEVESRMKELKAKKQNSPVLVAPDDVVNLLARKVGTGYQFSTKAGRYSYCIQAGKLPQKPDGEGVFGATIEPNSAAPPSEKSPSSPEWSEPASTQSSEEISDERETTGPIDGKQPAERNSEQLTQSLKRAGLL